MQKIYDFFLSKPFCILILFAAFVFGLVLPWMWGNDPFDELGTLSILCEDRKWAFWIWAILIGGAYLLNTNYAYRKYGENSKLLKVMTFVTFLACIAIALTLKHDVHSWNPKRIVHWIATGLYIVCVGLSIFSFLIRKVERYRGFTLLAILVPVIALSILVWLLTLGKSAMMEMIPNACMQILLGILNFTPLFKEKELPKKS